MRAITKDPMCAQVSVLATAALILVAVSAEAQWVVENVQGNMAALAV